MKKIITMLYIMAMACGLRAQQTVTVKFTGHDIYGNYSRLSQVHIQNHTRGWQEVITWPDTVLILQSTVGVEQNALSAGFELLPNVPNPFDGETDVVILVPGLPL